MATAIQAEHGACHSGLHKPAETWIYNAMAVLLNAVLLAACGGGGGSGAASYTVGGTLSGLAGSGLVLQINGGDDLTLSANQSFSFATKLARGTS